MVKQLTGGQVNSRKYQPYLGACSAKITGKSRKRGQTIISLSVHFDTKGTVPLHLLDTVLVLKSTQGPGHPDIIISLRLMVRRPPNRAHIFNLFLLRFLEVENSKFSGDNNFLAQSWEGGDLLFNLFMRLAVPPSYKFRLVVPESSVWPETAVASWL